MKKMKKILAMFLAMAMVLGMSMTTFAAGETDGTISVSNTTAGTKLSALQIIAPNTEKKHLPIILRQQILRKSFLVCCY